MFQMPFLTSKMPPNRPCYAGSASDTGSAVQTPDLRVLATVGGTVDANVDVDVVVETRHALSLRVRLRVRSPLPPPKYGISALIEGKILPPPPPPPPAKTVPV